MKSWKKLSLWILGVCAVAWLAAVGLTWNAIAGIDEWTPKNNGLYGGDIYALAINPSNPSTIYAGTRGGVFRSVDGGDNWIQINQGLTSLHVRSLSINPSNPPTIYAGTSGGGVFSYTDTVVSVLYGDVSGDGNITAYDASLIFKVVVGILNLNDPNYPYLTLERADVTGNGTVSAMDAALVLQYSVGLITKFPKSPTGAIALNR